jgi:adenosine deaminase
MPTEKEYESPEEKFPIVGWVLYSQKIIDNNVHSEIRSEREKQHTYQ